MLTILDHLLTLMGDVAKLICIVIGLVYVLRGSRTDDRQLEILGFVMMIFGSV